MSRPQRPLLLLDVDGVLCPFTPPWSGSAYHGPSGFRPQRVELDAGQVLEIWVSDANAKRLDRLGAAFDIVWATGWMHHANRVLAPLHGLAECPVVELRWSAEMADMEGSWKLPFVAEHVGDDQACVWIDDDLRPDAVEWARARRAPTLLVAADPSVGLTDDHVDRSLDFANRIGQAGRA